MALDERYLTPISLEVNFVDNDTGEPLSGGFAEFFKDNNRIEAKPVFQLTGSPPNYTYTPLSDPLFMNAVGKFIPAVGSTTPIAVYAYPFDEDGNVENYYVVIKNQNGTIQEVREAWPNLTSANDPTKSENSIANEISNSQFVDIFFEQDLGRAINISGITSNQEFSIAPDWDLIVSTSGNASITVNRTSIAGSLNLPTNPPYTLNVLTSGINISRLRLRQRLKNNPDIWANGFISGSFVISSQDGQNHTVEMLYAPSISPSPNTVVVGDTGNSGYQQYTATIELDAGTNTDISLVGYVDILLELPVVGHFDVTSIQVVGLNTDQQAVLYDQETVNRQEDHLFHYYKMPFQYKQMDSYLAGWFFPYNPSQWGENVSMGAIGIQKSAYLWDQTIGYQSADDSFAASRSSSGQLTITTSEITQVAIIQYLDIKTIKDLLSRPSSVYAKLMRGDATADTTCTISLWYTKDAMLPDVSDTVNNSLVFTLDTNGKPTAFNGAWIEVPRTTLGDATFTVNSSSVMAQNEKYFNSFYLGDASEADLATYGAIVIGFSSMEAASVISLTDISVVPGEIACPSNIKTPEQVLQECEFFYEQSYDSGVPPETITDKNKEIRQLIQEDPFAVNNRAYAIPFEIIYRNIKRIAPTISFYSPVTGIFGNVRSAILRANIIAVQTETLVSSYWGTPEIGVKSSVHVATNISLVLQVNDGQTTFHNSYISFHYVADSRLGIIL